MKHRITWALKVGTAITLVAVFTVPERTALLTPLEQTCLLIPIMSLIIFCIDNIQRRSA